MESIYYRALGKLFSFRTPVFAVLLTLLAVFGTNTYAFWGSKYTEVTPEGNTVRVPSAKITEKAHYFSLPTQRQGGGAVDVRFFLVRDKQGVAHLALDACDACWPAGKGYTQKDDVFTCENCGMQFNVTRIGMRKGGCNPHPVSFQEADGSIVIPLEELRQGAQFFK